jgi:hypothetical protein
MSYFPVIIEMPVIALGMPIGFSYELCDCQEKLPIKKYFQIVEINSNSKRLIIWQTQCEELYQIFDDTPPDSEDEIKRKFMMAIFSEMETKGSA